MAQNTNVIIRMDKNLKQEAKVFFKSLGLNMSTAINIFVRQSLKQHRIPFEIGETGDPFYNPENIKALRRVVKDLNDGNGKAHNLIEEDIC